MAFSQLFNLLCEKADDVYGGKLPNHVRFLMDEAANIGQVPHLQRIVSVIRSREISLCMILQAQSQLKDLYKEKADTIIGNMDSVLFLGGKEMSTLKEIEETLGTETIDIQNTSETRSNQKSISINNQKLGHKLMSKDELVAMKGDKCILQLRGERPFFSSKYDIEKHPMYKYLSDFDDKYLFNIEDYLEKNRKKAGKQETSAEAVMEGTSYSHLDEADVVDMYFTFDENAEMLL